MKFYKIYFNIVELTICIFLILFSSNCKNTDTLAPIKEDAMHLGYKLNAPTPQPEKYFDDLIHPCVRYVENGFAGHKWWMVATPYRGSDADIENPILYYGDSEDESIPPINWKATKIVEETPKRGGYNSDPCIYFDDENGLWVFWRANLTSETMRNNCTRATIGAYTKDGINFTDRKIFAKEVSITEDHEMCPIVMDFNNDIRLYGCNHRFSPDRIPIGLSIWEIKDKNLKVNGFTKIKDVVPKFKTGFDFWHFDIFEHNDVYYCVVTPEIADQILLGRSDDGENFTFWDTPLLSALGTGRTYFYKPSAMVLNGVFYLWCPVAEQGILPRTSRIWMSQINFEDLIKKLDYSNASNI